MEIKEGKPKIDKKEISKTENAKLMAEIAELEWPMQNILWQMGSRIENGEYGLILGEDLSGRLPTLLVWRVLENLYKETGFHAPETLFFASQLFGDVAKEEKLVNDFKNFLERSGAKEMAEDKTALIVTDTIKTGEHLKPFTQALKEMNLKFEIAAFNFVPSLLNFPQFGISTTDIERNLNGKIFCGRMSRSDLLLRSKKYLSGFIKSSEPDLFVKPFSDFAKSEVAKKNYSQKKAEARAARRDIKILAKKFAEWYKEEMANQYK